MSETPEIPTSPVLLSRVNEGVCTLTLHRPDRRNALDATLLTALCEAFEAAADDPQIRCIVLTGSGDRAFCSGADLDPRAAAAGPFAMHESRRRFVRLLRAMRGCGKPILAAIQGGVWAGGLGLVAAADLAIAADDVTFSAPEIKRGLFPMMIMAVLARSLSRKHLMELVLTGETFSAQQAVVWGLVNHAVPRESFAERVDTMATLLASYSPAVMRLGRDAFYAMEDMPLDPALDFLCDRLTVNTLTEDAAEGVMAFMQRRTPDWKGK